MVIQGLKKSTETFCASVLRKGPQSFIPGPPYYCIPDVLSPFAIMRLVIDIA